MVESIFNQDTWRSAQNLLQTANDDDIDEYCDKNGSVVNLTMKLILIMTKRNHYKTTTAT